MRHRPCAPEEGGTGLISSVFGVTIFLTLMIVGVQVVYALYARATVGLAAYDAAEMVSGANAASAGAVTLAEASANAHVADVLGGYGGHALITWRVNQNFVAVTVRVASPTLIPYALAHSMGIATATRTVVLRREHLL